jgi:hypothetical protein
VSRRAFNVTLPRRYRDLRSLVVYVGSERRRLPVRNGQVRISFVGVRSTAGRGVAVSAWIGGRRVATRLYTLCTQRGVGQVNVPPPRGA